MRYILTIVIAITLVVLYVKQEPKSEYTIDTYVPSLVPNYKPKPVNPPLFVNPNTYPTLIRYIQPYQPTLDNLINQRAEQMLENHLNTHH